MNERLLTVYSSTVAFGFACFSGASWSSVGELHVMHACLAGRCLHAVHHAAVRVTRLGVRDEELNVELDIVRGQLTAVHWCQVRPFDILGPRNDEGLPAFGHGRE